MEAGYLIDLMLPMGRVDDLHAGYYAIDNFTKPFPSGVMLFLGSFGPPHLAYIGSFLLEVPLEDITLQEQSFDFIAVLQA